MKIIISFILLAFLSGCSASLVLPRPTGEEIASLDSKKIISDIKLKTESISTFKINAKTTFEHKEEKIFNKSIMVARYPESFRLQILAPTVAYTLADLVYADGILTFYDLEKKKAYTDSTNKLFEDNTGIPLNIKDFIRLLVGVLPTRDLGEISKITKIDDNFYSVEGEGFYAKYSKEYNAVIEYQKLDGSDITTLVRCLNFATANGISIPQQIEITIPDKSAKVILVSKSIELNSEIPDYILKPKTPDEIEVSAY